MSGALGVVPAVAFGAGAALAALKLGTTGFDDALKELNKGDLGKFNADVAKMAPNAQAAAFAIRDIYTTGFRNLQLDVQQRLFAGLAGEIRDLGSTYLPVLHSGLGGVADELNLAARGIADWAKSSATVRDTSTLFDAVRSTMHELAPAVVNVAQGILDIGTVGSRDLPGLAAQATNLTARFRDFMDQARQSGQLGEFIQTGIDKLEQLGRIAGNAGGILVSIFRASVASGADFLSTIERITAGVNNFLRSGEGQSILTSVFREINATVDALEPGVAALAKAAAEVLRSSRRPASCTPPRRPSARWPSPSRRSSATSAPWPRRSCRRCCPCSATSPPCSAPLRPDSWPPVWRPRASTRCGRR
jgi:hypothetical protein